MCKTELQIRVFVHEKIEIIYIQEKKNMRLDICLTHYHHSDKEAFSLYVSSQFSVISTISRSLDSVDLGT